MGADKVEMGMEELLERGFKDITYLLHPGVYILLNKGEVIYVGQTVRPLNRIGAHQNKIIYDQVLFIRCKEKELKELEWDLIWELDPLLNMDKPCMLKAKAPKEPPRPSSTRTMESFDRLEEKRRGRFKNDQLEVKIGNGVWLDVNGYKIPLGFNKREPELVRRY